MANKQINRIKPDLENLMKIAKLLDVDIAELLRTRCRVFWSKSWSAVSVEIAQGNGKCDLPARLRRLADAR